MSTTTPQVPAPLQLATAVAAAEGLALLVLAVVQVASLSGDRVALGVTTAAFFVGFGALVLACARAVRERHTWARGPLLLAQLITLGLAWNFRADILVAAVLLVVGAAGLAGLVHPQTTAALADDPEGAEGSGSAGD